MAVINKIFIVLLLIQTGLAGTLTYNLFKEGAYISMGIQSALIFLSVVISFMTFWTNSIKYLYMYIITMVLWIILEVFLYLDIFGIFHVLDSLDDLIIGTTAKNNYKNNTKAILSLTSYLYMGLLGSMVVGTIVSFFIKLTKTVKQTDEYGNVYRSSKVVSIIGPGEKKTRFASQVNIIGDDMGGDPGIKIIPNNNNYFNSLNFKRDSRRKDIDYNNYNKLQNDSPSSFLGSNSPPMGNNTDLRRMKNDNQLNPPNSRYNEDYYSIMKDRSDTDVKFTTLSHGVKPEAPRSIMKQQEDDANRSNTWDRSVASRRGHEARERNDRARNRERIRERERERMRERSRNRDRERGDRTRDRDRRDRGERNRDEDSPRSRSNREKERNNRKRYEDEEEEEEEKELHPGNISSREELESYLNKSSMSIYLNKSMISEKNPKFVSMFEIEENASDVDSEDDFTMNHFTIKCKICKKDIPIEEVENHQCESNNIPLINVETEEHKKAMEEKARKEQEEKERKEREEREKKEKEEKERREKEEKERQEKEEKERKEKEEERARQRKQRERERERRREERSRERRRDERSRERKPSVRDHDRDHDRDRERRRRDKDAEWEQRYNNKSSDRTKDRDRERDRSERRRRKEEDVREGGRYEIIINYDQILNDEVSVKIGDVFEVERIFEDGWCVGTNLSTNKWGAIPLNCLNNKQERRRRIQSLYMS